MGVRVNVYRLPRVHTTIGLKKTTKVKLDNNRAPGQCYDGFLCQLMDFWEHDGNPIQKIYPQKSKQQIRR